MKMIPLTQGQVALVDDDDFERVSSFNWIADKDRHTYYAVSNLPGRPRRKLTMQNLILRSDALIDHKDGNGLNNTKANLRTATPAQNAANCRRVYRTNKTGYRGVTVQKGRYLAQIHTINKAGIRKAEYLGRFDTPEEAAHAYDDAARRLRGEFAVVNFPLESERQNEPVTVERCLFRISELEDQLSSRDREIKEVLSGFIHAGVEFDDARVKYVVMQIDRRDLEAAKALYNKLQS